MNGILFKKIIILFLENVNWEFELGCLLQSLPSEQETLSIIDKESM